MNWCIQFTSRHNAQIYEVIQNLEFIEKKHPNTCRTTKALDTVVEKIKYNSQYQIIIDKQSLKVK